MCGRRNRKLLLFNDTHHLPLPTHRVSAYAASKESVFVIPDTGRHCWRAYMRQVASSPLAPRLRKRKRAISFKMYALLTLAVTCLCLCALQYSILSGTHAAHIEAPHHGELALRVGEMASKHRQIWDDHEDTSVRYRNMSATDPTPLGDALYLGAPSLTALLPVTAGSLPLLETQLHTLMNRSDYLTEIVLIPQESLQAECRRVLLSFLSALAPSAKHVELSFAPWTAGADKASATLRAVKQVTTPLLLVLDEDGLENIDERGRDALTLLSPFSTAVPLGPRGVASTAAEPACLSASEIPQPTDYLVPPFILPAHFFLRSDFDVRSNAGDTWRYLGKAISDERSDSVGGFMVGSDLPGSQWCTLVDASTTKGLEVIPLLPVLVADESYQDTPHESLRDACPANFGSITLLLSSLEELHHISLAACSLQHKGHTLHIAVLSDATSPPLDDNGGDHESLQLRECSLSYVSFQVENKVQAAASTLPWLDISPSDVVITSWPKDSLLAGALAERQDAHNTPVIYMPRGDLPYCDWMGTLNLDELRSKYDFLTRTASD